MAKTRTPMWLWAAFTVLILSFTTTTALALDRPWISDTFFYWYTWEDEQEVGNWVGGIGHTPLVGYYDSRRLEHNHRELWMASEWGMTHHFMDYWGQNWLGEGGEPRELTVMRAAEELRKAGYDIWMSYYQDGNNFAMDDFSRNISEKRDVYQWLRDYAKSPVWPKLNGFPYQLVYGRNGAPKLKRDDAGFRDYLRRRYNGLEKLNQAWGSTYQSFDELKLDFGRGPLRAASIDYQYLLWHESLAKTNALVKQEFGYPGARYSFDVGYEPFLGYGYSDFTRTFGGPHSYGGIFERPETLDVERFCQSMVAKHYDTVFFDHLKHEYCDWNTIGRVPGTYYHPEPHHFDRFWVGALARYSEALLHLSWNEWWEGSNLEPSWEHGKTYCEKNLFYSTIMQQCFPSLRDAGKNAKVAVLLNDWSWKCGVPSHTEVYEIIQTLRRLMVPFDLLPDDFVTSTELGRFALVIAPAANLGFGQNRQGESIASVLQAWIAAGQDRKLLVSACPEFFTALKLKQGVPAAPADETGPDLNVYIDFGVEGDDRFLLEGYAQREDWGTKDHPHTVRWTPGVGDQMSLLLPVSPHREHILRFMGDANWPNTITVQVDDETAGTVTVQVGLHEYELVLPAKLFTSKRAAEIRLVYQKHNVPGEIEPARYPGEARVCDLAVDWVQFSTSNLGHSTEQRYRLPKEQVRFEHAIFGALQGKTTELDLRRHTSITAEGATVLSTYVSDQSPRDLLFVNGRNETVYVNGQLEGLPEGYLSSLAQSWGGQWPGTTVRGGKICGTELRAENTHIICAINQQPGTETTVTVTVPLQGRIVSEVVALRSDGDEYERPRWSLPRQGGPELSFENNLRYFAVYEVAFSPIRVTTPELVIAPGERRDFECELENISDAPQSGSLALVSTLPTLGMIPAGRAVNFTIEPGKRMIVSLPVQAAETIDWGRKTVMLRVATKEGAALLWRELLVQPPSQIELASRIVDARQPKVVVRNARSPITRAAPATVDRVTVSLDEQTMLLGSIRGGEEAGVELPITVPASPQPTLLPKKLTVAYDAAGKRVSKEFELPVAITPPTYPRLPDARTPFVVFNPTDQYLENWPITFEIPKGIATTPGLFVRDSNGQALPSQVDFDRELTFLALLPPRSAITLYLCQGLPPATWSDLRVKVNMLGTGTGTLTLANSHFELVFDEKVGGTATSFRSLATQTEYGAQSFGISYGQWSKHDPQVPAQTTDKYVVEERTRQADSTAKIKVIASGPVRVVFEVTWSDRAVEARQRYEVYAYADFFKVQVSAQPKRMDSMQELVALDARFARAGLTKIFPDYSGQPEAFDQAQPHFGWREAEYVPPFATLMTPSNFPESISLIIGEQKGINHWRQGFWPEHRPKAGPCRYAWCEVVAQRPGDTVNLTAYLRLHTAHQVIGRRFSEQVIQGQPIASIPPKFSWQDPDQPIAEPQPVPTDWWNAYWRYRVPVTVDAGDFERQDMVATASVDFAVLVPGKQLDPNSIRLLEVDASGRALGLVRYAVQPQGTSTELRWQISGLLPARSQRRYCLYFDTTEGIAKQPDETPLGIQPVGAPSQALLNPGMEEGGLYWTPSNNAQWTNTGAHSGTGAFQLSVTDTTLPSLVSNNSLKLEPNSTYKVTFWAKLVSGTGLLRINFYQGAKYDFTQQQVDLKADNEWHQYEVNVPTAKFPSGVNPTLRIFAAEKQQMVMIDEVTVQPTAGNAARPAPKITTGAVQALSIPR